MSTLYAEHADLYDAAFEWDNHAELTWLAQVIGPAPRRVLEPMCGSGRLLAGLIAGGYEVVGVDASTEMLRRARVRLGSSAQLHEADVADFSLAQACDAAVCPFNSFGHLTARAAAGRHLQCVARALYPGAVYWVQMGLRNYALLPDDAVRSWEFEYHGVRLKFAVYGTAWDARSGIEQGSYRVEWLSGEHQGRVLLDPFEMRVWDWSSWQALLSLTQFEQVAAFDGDASFAELPLGEALHEHSLAWHALVVRG